MTQFHNVGSITEKNRISTLEDNLKSFLDWSFLNIGGFINVSTPANAISLSFPSRAAVEGRYTLTENNIYQQDDGSCSIIYDPINLRWQLLEGDGVIRYYIVASSSSQSTFANGAWLPVNGSGSGPRSIILSYNNPSLVGPHLLKPSSDPTIKGNRLWESMRKDWIYETGIVYNNTSPTPFSGVYLNNVLLPAPTGSGSYGYFVNYPLGQIQFTNPVSSASKVTADYSYRYVQTYKASESFWWKEVQKETYNSSNFKTNGDYSITSVHRVQLPAVIIELAPRTELKPYQLGTTENIWTQDIFLHIFSNTANHRNILTDILLAQKDKVLFLYDSNRVAQNHYYPILRNGSINPSGQNYPSLVSNFKTNWYTIKDSSIGELNTLSSSLYNSIIRWSVEILP